jgi:catechol 2,3-dioxygenase-like lactoylglutathione lyase family enzyme
LNSAKVDSEIDKDANMEQPQLGWLAVCLSVNDLAVSAEFYRKLDFVVAGGGVDQGYIVMQQRNCELHLHAKSTIQRDMLNFRGADVRMVVEWLKTRGLVPQPGHVLSDGTAVDTPDGCTAACYFDPDGVEVMFDTHPDEAKWLAKSEPFCTPGARAKVAPDAMLLGNFSICHKVADLPVTLKFYEALGFSLRGGQPEHGWAALALGDGPCHPEALVDKPHLALMQGFIEANLLNWRGGNVPELAAILAERGVSFIKALESQHGCDNFLIADPDGRVLMFDTCEGEKLY